MISTPEVCGAGDSTGNSSPIRGRDEQLEMITGFLQRVGAGVGGVSVPGSARPSTVSTTARWSGTTFATVVIGSRRRRQTKTPS